MTELLREIILLIWDGGRALFVVGDNTMADREPNGRYVPGHHLTQGTGRPLGSVNKRTRTAEAWFQKYDFDPLEKKIKLALRLERKLVDNSFKETYERIEYLKLYAETLRDILQYGYQRLKAVEHFGTIEIVQKLQAIETCTDAELQALLAEAEELTRVLSS